MIKTNEADILLKVIRVKGKQINQADVGVLLNSFDINKGKQIFIKPNLAVPASSKSGIVTDINLIAALIDLLHAKGFTKIVIGEGPVIGHKAVDVFEGTGYRALAEKKGVDLVDLNTAERQKVKWQYGEIAVPRIINDSYYINVAKLKTHVQTTVSLTMKNQKGLLLPIDKRRFHRDWGIHWPIAFLSQVVKPDLAIIDGFIGLEGDGPLTGGKPRKLGLLGASDNMITLDSFFCYIIGINPESVLHLKYAQEIGVGTFAKPSAKMLQKYNLHNVHFKRANEELRKVGKIYAIRNPHACTGCGDAIAGALHQFRSKPAYWPRIATIFAYRLLLGGMVILTGKNPSYKCLKGKKICVGQCTKAFAEAKRLCYVPGCPPKHEAIAKALLE